MIYFVYFFTRINFKNKNDKYESIWFCWLSNSSHKLNSLIFQVFDNWIQHKSIKSFKNLFGRFCIFWNFPSLFDCIWNNIFAYFSFQVKLIFKIGIFTNRTFNPVRIDKSTQMLNLTSNLIFLSFIDFRKFFIVTHFFQKLFVLLFQNDPVLKK